MNDGYAIMVSDFIRKALSSTGFLAKVSCEYEVGKKYTTLCLGRDKEIECAFNDDLNSCDITISFTLGEEPELFQPDKNKQVFFLKKCYVKNIT